jgi:hypothetical protein
MLDTTTFTLLVLALRGRGRRRAASDAPRQPARPLTTARKDWTRDKGGDFLVGLLLLGVSVGLHSLGLL